MLAKTQLTTEQTDNPYFKTALVEVYVALSDEQSKVGTMPQQKLSFHGGAQDHTLRLGLGELFIYPYVAMHVHTTQTHTQACKKLTQRFYIME